MKASSFRGVAATLGLVLVAGSALSAQAQDRPRHRERPLTITKHTGQARGTGLEYRDGGNTVVAWGGFGANGYGYGRPGSEAARRGARNDSVRYRTAGVYGYGYDGLGGTFDNNDLRSGGGYNNPNYGNAFNSYTGYNGVPTNLAFGPGFASRHITDGEADDDDDLQGPGPGQAGNGTSPVAFDLDE